jgi:hypothetical protein
MQYHGRFQEGGRLKKSGILLQLNCISLRLILFKPS